ncbi:site-specific integrase [Fertoebacter nigrum]|uniref:Site-specific integrase n=1 Tax=Fertoeibacter niger TaxID=2656921 RepID=A0A8X8GT05_9RHOB|nr:site-specific integrase [Fertoeibacter niger]NUB43809.1 site-specific integrase [Fertoeibacter niger]
MKKNTLHIGDVTITEEIKSGVPTGSWRIDLAPALSPTGKRVRYRYPSKTAAQNAARKFMKDREIADHLGRQGTPSFTLNDVFTQFVDHETVKIKAGRKREGSFRTDLNALKHVLTHLGDHELRKIDDSAVARYQATRKDAGMAEVTINTEVRKLRLLLNWCREKRMIDLVPKFIDLVEPPTHTEVPTLPEMMLILDQLKYRHRVLVRLMCETGLRASEAYRLRWENVDLVRRTVRVVSQGRITPKTRYSTREVHIGAGLAADLREVSMCSDWVFPQDINPARPMVCFKKSLRSAVKRSGVKRYGGPIRFTPKYGRKAFTSYQWIRGTPLELIRKMVGHSPNSRVTEQNYLHIPAESAREAVLDLDLMAAGGK